MKNYTWTKTISYTGSLDYMYIYLYIRMKLFSRICLILDLISVNRYHGNFKEPETLINLEKTNKIYVI